MWRKIINVLKKCLQFRCTNCGEESDKWIYLSQDVSNSSYIYFADNLNEKSFR